MPKTRKQRQKGKLRNKGHKYFILGGQEGYMKRRLGKDYERNLKQREIESSN